MWRGLLIVFVLASGVVHAQQDTTHKIVNGIFADPKLQPYRKAATEQYASFKNRFALEALKHMDAAADTLFVADMQKSEDELKQKQQAETKEQVAKLTEQSALIKSLEDQNDVLRTERNRLWRKAVLSIVVWLIMVALFVMYRLRMFAKTSKVLAESEQALAITEKFHERGKKLMEKVEANAAILVEAVNTGGLLAAEAQKHAAASAGIIEPLTHSFHTITSVASMNNRLRIMANQMTDEKQTVDVNALCEQMVMIGNSGIETEDGKYHFTITKDLEKKLPPVKVNEQGLSRVMVFLMSNALNACYRQSKTGVKGYQPKITVSTRVLPRFVQVKVKDNGAGVKDDVSEEVYNSFFTTETGKKAGLGLTICKDIIEKTKGELKIESALDRGTDVTIKLFLESK